MSSTVLDRRALLAALSLRDLTDPEAGPHAMQLLVADALDALRRAWALEVRVHRQSPIVSVADHYDRLHYPPDGAAREARYSRYVCEGAMLRAQTSAMIPPLLRGMAREPLRDVLLACPGLVYRRDCIDRLHTGEPHQMDLWRVRPGEPLGRADLLRMIELVIGALLPGRALRVLEVEHPYTVGGLQIDVEAGGEWVEVGECGVASPALLAESGLPVPQVSGLAMGLGLDRIVMLRKGLDDIRLLRSSDARIQAQMLDLGAWRPVSSMPPVRRDLSLAVDAGTSSEELGDEVRAALGPEAEVVEGVEVRSETPGAELPPQARERLGLLPGQKNVLLRVTLRSLERTLTDDECNRLRDRIYAALHRGTVHAWASQR